MKLSRLHLLILALLVFSFSVSAEDLIVDGGTQTLDGLQEYDKVEIINGGTLEVGNEGNLNIKARDIYVDSQSMITGSEKGPGGGFRGYRGFSEYSPADGGGGGNNIGGGQTGGDIADGNKDGGGGGGAGSYGGEGGYGGDGGGYGDYGYTNGGPGGAPGPTYGDKDSMSIRMGSGAGGGGGGGYATSQGTYAQESESGDSGEDAGGAITLEADSIEINGDIRVDGGSGGNGGTGGEGVYEGDGGGAGGGASGGGILIMGDNVELNGYLSARGGSGGTAENSEDAGYIGEDGDRGGGGRIKVFYGTQLGDSGATYDVSGYRDGTIHKEQSENIGFSFCNIRGPLNECIMNQRNQLTNQQYNISSIFEARNNAVFEAPEGLAIIKIENSTTISGLWRGSFKIKTDRARIKAGAKFRPENGNIRIGN